MAKFKYMERRDLLHLLTQDQKTYVHSNSELRGVDAFVLFENLNPQDRHYGRRIVVAVGPDMTHKSTGELNGAWLDSPKYGRLDAVAFTPSKLLPHERRTH